MFTCRPKPSLQTLLKMDNWKFMFSYCFSTRIKLVVSCLMRSSSFSHCNAHSPLELNFRHCWISALSFCLCMTGAISLWAMLRVSSDRAERASYRKEGPSRFPHDGWWQLQSVWFGRIISLENDKCVTNFIVIIYRCPCQRAIKVGSVLGSIKGFTKMLLSK